MFSKKRPVPSNATLRILYQLAYVSSGTVAGFATLCAEERRRRTKLVQKIADNAQRLRQSPRYYQNVAISTHVAESTFFQIGRVEEEDEQLCVEHSVHNGLVARSSTLPSEVDRTYTQLAEGAGARKRWRRRTPDATVELQTWSNNDVGMSFPNLARVPPVRGADTKQFDQGQRRPSPRNMLPNVGPPLSTHNTQSTQDRLQSLAGTVSSGKPMSDELQRRIDLFTSEARTQASMDEQSLHKLGTSLLRPAAIHCLFPLLRSVLSWKLSRDSLSLEDVDYVCGKAAYFFGSGIKPHVVLDFYNDLFSWTYPARSKNLAQADLVRMGLDVFCAAVVANSSGHSSLKIIKSGLLDHFVGDGRTIPGMLWYKCRELLDSGNIQSAVQIYLAIRPADLSLEEFTAMSEQVFVAALQERLLSSAALVLRRLDHPQRRALLPTLCDRFLQACDEQQLHTLVVSLFLSRKRCLNHCDMSQLSPKANEIIAYVCVKQRHVTGTIKRRLESALDRVPASLRQRILKDGSQHNLHLLWRRTRNLPLVREECVRSVTLLNRLQEPQAASNLLVSMSEILVSAGDIDQALAVLMENKGRYPQLDGHGTLIVATILAKTAPPSAVAQFLDTAKASGLLQLNGENAARFNGLLRILSKRVTLKSLFKFTARAVDSYGFIPDASTTATLFKASVWQRDLDLLLPWFKFLDLRNHHMHLDVDTTVTVLREFHRAYRPSSNEFLGIIKRIIRGASRLDDSKAYLDAFKSAAAWHIGQSIFSGRRDAIFWQQGMISRLENHQTGLRRTTRESASLKKLQYGEQENASYTLTQIPTAYDLATGQGLPDEYSELQNDPMNQSRYLPREPDPFRTKDQEASMLLALASHQYEEVLRLYRASSGDHGLPSSMLALRLAVDASIQRNGGQSEHAQQLLADARAAGFHVPAATTPVELAQMRALPKVRWKDPSMIRNLLVEHYREHSRLGDRISPHLANTAGHLLIRRHEPSAGVDLLRAIFQSDWPDRPEMDIATMTIFFGGYAAMEHWEGMQWVVDTVFERRMFLTKKFHRELKIKAQEIRRRLGPACVQHERVQSWVSRSLQQRTRQDLESANFGHHLASKIIALANVLDYTEKAKKTRLDSVLSLIGQPSMGKSSSSLLPLGVEEDDLLMRRVPISAK